MTNLGTDPSIVIPLPFVTGSATSEGAAKKKGAATKAAGDRKRILDEIERRKEDGMTCWEVERDLHLLHQTASARLPEMHCKFGSIQRSGQRRPTNTNTPADVWIFVPPLDRPAVKAVAQAAKELKKFCGDLAQKMRDNLTLDECRVVAAAVDRMIYEKGRVPDLGGPELPHPSST